MKFGKKLAKCIDESLIEWKDYFVDYKRLKKLIKKLKKLANIERGDSTSSPQRIHNEQELQAKNYAFIEELKKEIAKVRKFYEEREIEYRALYDQIISAVQLLAQTEIQRFSNGGGISQESWNNIFQMQKQIVNIHYKLVSIENFILMFLQNLLNL